MVRCRGATPYLDKVRRLPPVQSCLKLFMAVLCPPDFRMTWERMCLMKRTCKGTTSLRPTSEDNPTIHHPSETYEHPLRRTLKVADPRLLSVSYYLFAIVPFNYLLQHYLLHISAIFRISIYTPALAAIPILSFLDPC